MKNTEIIIKEDCIDDAINVSQKIPEFEDTYTKSEYESRLNNVKHLVLSAYIENKPVGFKIGYETQSKQNFYSWMGGVLPKYRQKGVAEKLMVHQKQWANKIGYQRILIKTLSKHIAMIKFLHKHGFIQMGIIPHNPDEETRIILEKKL
jgi:predicted GNAT superfamily acetyltransferase